MHGRCGESTPTADRTCADRHGHMINYVGSPGPLAVWQESGLVELPPSCASRLQAVVRPHRTKKRQSASHKTSPANHRSQRPKPAPLMGGAGRTGRRGRKKYIPRLKACSEKLRCWPQADLGQNRAGITEAILKACLYGSSAGILEQRT